MAEESNTPKLRFPEFTDAWEQRKLCQITKYRNGRGYEGLQSDEGSYELINLNSISIDGGLKPSGKFIEDGTDTLLENDLVMVLSDVGHGDLLGRVAIIPKNNRFVLNQRVALLRIIDETNPYFLFSIINKHQAYFKREGAGSSQLNISKASVENFVVDYPQIEEQVKIGEYFSNLDNLITLHQRKLEKIKTIKKAMLQKMFPKAGEKFPEVRFPEFTEAWEQRKFGKVFIRLQNNTLSRADLNLESGIAHNVHYGDVLVKFGEYIDASKEDLPYITDDSVVNKFTKSFLQDGDIVIADTAEDSAVGKCSEIVGSEGKTIISGLHTMAYRPNKKFGTKFFGYYLNSAAYHDQLIPLMQGIKVTSISKSAIQDTDLIIPTSMEEQSKIGSYFSNLDSLINLHQRKLDTLKTLKKGFLQQMFV